MLEKIEAMVSARIILKRELSDSTEEYRRIYELIEEYIDKNCVSHKIIEDYIDISPEQTKKICYCQICHKTFD